MNIEILENAYYHLESDGDFMKGDWVEDCYILQVRENGEVKKIHSFYNPSSMEYAESASPLTKEEILGLAIAKEVMPESPIESLENLGYRLIAENEYPWWFSENCMAKNAKSLLMKRKDGMYLFVPGEDYVCGYIGKMQSYGENRNLTIQEVGALGSYIQMSGMPYQTHRQYI